MSSSPDLVNVALTGTTYFTANALVNISNVYSSINVSSLPAFCRLELTITTNTTAGSFALTEVWLPDVWNNRMLTLGNGGLAGGVTVAELGHVAIPQGFAGISTNTGHDGDTNDGAWAGPHNDNAIVDWGWRALHLSVQAGKAVVEQYYQAAPTRSYYLGCSAGALKEVQTFPQEFDGVIVGSPADWWTHVQAWSIHMNLNTQPSTSKHFMTEDMWQNLIGPEVLRQCDAADGLVDGVISLPRNCHFRPETLTCGPGQSTSQCLTTDQISALQRIYAPYYEADQTLVFGGYYPGGEADFYNGLVGKTQFKIGVAWYQFMVTNDTRWTIHDYNATLLALSDTINPGQANANDPNITAFLGPQHNGKLLHYVGWADQLISPENPIRYYETVHEVLRGSTNINIDDVYRLFMAPGMQHCHGGPGANAFGSVEQASNNNPPLSFDPQHNIVAAMVQWVEEGIAPDTLTAAHYVGNDAANGVEFTRTLCRYPLNPRFNGGDPNNAASFDCI
ncbi:feruloyl esterase-like protein [Epithele typhae]|uniref:feruloyl esterase-like protein n=1 Tax=Epithele typhae TaxID=378194 RepID=UPI002008ADB0|nr:feruloyl esterase-like protein [Epithele typhae]KAH9945412.1 feruloyl esterase-like protein [Epithele typhae]